MIPRGYDCIRRKFIEKLCRISLLMTFNGIPFGDCSPEFSSRFSGRFLLVNLLKAR